MMEYYIKEADTIMRYQDFPGDSTPILFIHGLGCAGSFDYPPVAAQNSLRMQVIPWHGKIPLDWQRQLHAV